MAQGDADPSLKGALEQIKREENWILDSWDLPPVERTDLVRTQPSQLYLSFV